MAMRAYTLSEQYKDTFVGGHVTSGVDGRSVDLSQLLSEGNGEIITEDAVFQSVLENYFGAVGLVFDVHEVQGEERVPVNTHIEGGAPMPPIPLAPAPPPTPTVGSASAAGMPDATHGEDSEYHNMPMSELREIASERQLGVPGNIKKDELVARLEADDMQRTLNPQ